jgi:DNA recombination-dependent growth factor C
VLGPVPSERDLLAALQKDAFHIPGNDTWEEAFGWCDWRNFLTTPPDENYVFNDRFAVIGLRIDTRKVPGYLMKAHLDKEIKGFMEAKNLAFVGKEARISIQDEIKARLLPKMNPASKLIEIAWDRKGGQMFVANTSNKVTSTILELFVQSFGCEIQPMVPLILSGIAAPKLSVEKLLGADPYDFKVE